jgi:hypothetical protein
MSEVFTREQLKEFEASFDYFVGIDSDGCVFPSMEIKQKQCFQPAMMDHWNLHSIEKYLREAAEFVNLYSKMRGRNRFLSLVDSLDLLRERPEVVESGVEIPEFGSLRKWIASTTKLGNPELQEVVDEGGDPELKKVLEWSLDVNERVAQTVKRMAPFEWALKSLKMMPKQADTICVSQTPTEALVREWAENDIRQYVHIIAGQELGTKTEHISLATGGKYENSKIIMIGDAPGDRTAAKDNAALFYPINPDGEEASWERFHEEAFGKFLDGTYAGDYEAKLIHEFEDALPETPPWKE